MCLMLYIASAVPLPPVEYVGVKPRENRLVRQLRAYLEDATQRAGVVQLYHCWQGDQGKRPRYRSRITPAMIGADNRWGASFHFRERQFHTVTRGV